MDSSVSTGTSVMVSPHTADNPTLSGQPVSKGDQQNTVCVHPKGTNHDAILHGATNSLSQTPALTAEPSLTTSSTAPATPQNPASTTTSTTTTTTSTTANGTSLPSSSPSSAATNTSISPQSDGIAGSSSGDANPNLATPPDANQTSESQRKKHPSVPISQIDFKKISGQIKEVRQDVEEINAKLLKILEELEGYVSNNPDLRDQVLAIQDSLKKSMDATEVAKGHLKTAERQKDVINKALKQSANERTLSTHSEKKESEKVKKDEKKKDNNKSSGLRDRTVELSRPSTGESGVDKNKGKKELVQTNSGSLSPSSTFKTRSITPRVEEVEDELEK